MIYLTPGITASIWMSLRESVPYGNNEPFEFTITNDISGDKKVFQPIDLQPNNKWSRFNILVDKPESLPGTIDMVSGMWNYSVSVGVDNIIETGKIIVQETKTWSARKTPDKKTIARRREI